MKGMFKKFPKFQKFLDGLSADEQKEINAAIGTNDAELTLDQRMDKIEKAVSGLAKIVKRTSDDDRGGWNHDEKENEEDTKTEDYETPEEEEEAEKKSPGQKNRGWAETDKRSKDKRAKDEEETEREKKERKEKETKDSAYMSKDAAPVFQEILYRSSILAPSLSRPTHDSIKDMKKKTFDEACCLLKRKSLDAAWSTADGKAAILPFLMGKQSVDFFTADCATCDLAFVGASEVLKKSGTNDRVTHGVHDFGRHTTVSDINKKNADFWANRGGK